MSPFSARRPFKYSPCYSDVYLDHFNVPMVSLIYLILACYPGESQVSTIGHFELNTFLHPSSDVSGETDVQAAEHLQQPPRLPVSCHGAS